MPNRMLYASLLTSKKVNSLSADAFELYVRLILVADDFGRYEGSPVRISRSCWPDREDKTSAKIAPLLRALAVAELIILYAVDGENYLQITNWNQRTRQSESKFPQMSDKCPSNDGQMTVKCRSSAHVDVDVDVDVDDRRNNCTEQTSCSPPIIMLPLNDKSFFEINQEQVDKWALLYPSVDIMSELRKMIGWLESNPKKKKTKSGIGRFITGWLAREQDKPKTTARYPDKPKQNFTGVEYDEEFLKRLEVDPVELAKKLKEERK